MNAVGQDQQALIAITLDLEMSRHYPRRGMTEWDYEKGNLNEPTKEYTVEACRRVKAQGGVLHCFVLGQTLEQENVDWLHQIIEQGHPIGNHTYDHVNVMASRTEEIQYRFQRAPWLIQGKTPPDVIAENIRLASMAVRTRLGVEPSGFRTPGGYHDGLAQRPDVQRIILDCGFTWLTAKAEDVAVKSEDPDDTDFRAVVAAQAGNQPFAYPSGLIEIPASPLGDVACFRNRKWKLAEFLRMVEANVRWTIEQRAVYDFFSHPSILYVEDPEFRTVDLICDLVRQSGGKAAIVALDAIADRVKLP